jgi:hypothetical protein
MVRKVAACAMGQSDLNKPESVFGSLAVFPRLYEFRNATLEPKPAQISVVLGCVQHDSNVFVKVQPTE